MPARRTYLDYNASAPLRAEARAAMVAALELVGNPSSVHAEGRKARAVIEQARLDVAALVGARTADVVFTSGASEANANVLAGGWQTILLSALEHDSVRAAAKTSGADLIEIAVNAGGAFDVGALADRVLAADVAGFGRTLVSLQLANNETGVIQPVAEVAAFARTHGLSVHCDAVQAPGRVPVDCAALGIDFLTLSAHKLGGPKGAGALVIVDGAALRPLIAGGGQERGRRAGTENIAAIAGFGAAARCALADLQSIEQVRAMRDQLEAGIAARTPDAVIVGRDAPRLANTTCVALAGLTAETAVIRLDLAGVSVSAGAACSSGKVGASAALTAMGLKPELARAAIRVSLGHFSTDDDGAAFLAAWNSIAVAQQRAA
jgi:cysteine desulfurase